MSAMGESNDSAERQSGSLIDSDGRINDDSIKLFHGGWGRPLAFLFIFVVIQLLNIDGKLIRFEYISINIKSEYFIFPFLYLSLWKFGISNIVMPIRLLSINYDLFEKYVIGLFYALLLFFSVIFIVVREMNLGVDLAISNSFSGVAPPIEGGFFVWLYIFGNYSEDYSASILVNILILVGSCAFAIRDSDVSGAWKLVKFSQLKNQVSISGGALKVASEFDQNTKPGINETKSVNQLDEVVQSLRHRAGRHRQVAYLLGFMMLVALGIGFVAFLFPDKFSQDYKSEAAAQVSAVESYIGNLKAVFAEINDVKISESDINEIKNEIKNIESLAYDANKLTNSIWTDLEGKIKEVKINKENDSEIINVGYIRRVAFAFSDFVSKNSNSGSQNAKSIYDKLSELFSVYEKNSEFIKLKINDLNDFVEIDEMLREAKKMSARLGYVGTVPVEAREEREFYSSQIRRFGSIAILFFVVLFLGTRFDHQIRLAAHYDNSADVFMLYKTSGTEKHLGGMPLQDLMKILAPTSIRPEKVDNPLTALASATTRVVTGLRGDQTAPEQSTIKAATNKRTSKTAGASRAAAPTKSKTPRNRQAAAKA